MKKLIIILIILTSFFACKKKDIITQSPFPPCQKTSENVSGKWLCGYDTIKSIYQSVDCDEKGNNTNYYKVIGISKAFKETFSFRDSVTFPNLDTVIVKSIESNYQLIYPNQSAGTNWFEISKQGGGWRLDIYYASTNNYKSQTLIKL